MPEDLGPTICKVCGTYDPNHKGLHEGCKDYVAEAVRLAVQKERGIWMGVIGKHVDDERIAHYLIGSAMVAALELPDGT